jgi:uncharacterized protein involved in response to NO
LPVSPFSARASGLFFSGGAAWAATAMILWVGELAGLWQFAESYGSALLRLSAPLFAGATTAVLLLAGFSWIDAFGIFVAAYGAMLVQSRQRS